MVNINAKKLIVKYLVILIVAIVCYKITRPLTFDFIYNRFSDPLYASNNFPYLQAVADMVMYAINIIILIIVVMDKKPKGWIDWLILLLILIRFDLGIVFFVFWQLYQSVQTVNKIEKDINEIGT